MRLLGGPCEGAFAVRRAPRFLRAVRKADGSTDVLDQLDDTPAEDEAIHVYECVANNGTVHLNFGSRSGRSGFYVSADYKHLPDVDGEGFRDNAAWREWCIAHMHEGDDIPEVAS